MKIIDLTEYLRAHSYPGRGILLGRSADNKSAVIAYFIMGRSANSRNRVFTPVTEDNGIMTEAYDPSKMEDPSLIIYHPVRYVEKTGDTVVTNGDQTDTVRDGILEGKAFAQALRVRCFEPDPPNYTPRISGLVHQNGAFALSILKSADGDPTCNNRYFFGYDHPKAEEIAAATPIRRTRIPYPPLRVSRAVWRLPPPTPIPLPLKSGKTSMRTIRYHC